MRGEGAVKHLNAGLVGAVIATLFLLISASFTPLSPGNPDSPPTTPPSTPPPMISPPCGFGYDPDHNGDLHGIGQIRNGDRDDLHQKHKRAPWCEKLDELVEFFVSLKL